MSKSFKKNSVCVIGVGRFGSAVVEGLIEQGNSVLVLDKDELILKKAISSSSLITPIVVDAADLKALQSIGIQEIETVVVGLSDNIEIVAALLELNVKHIIARANSRRHARVLKQIGVDVIIQPEYESGIKTSVIATNSNFIRFSKNLTELEDGFVIGSTSIINNNFSKKPIKDLALNKIGITIVMIKRDNESFLPDGKKKLNLGDTLTVVGKVEDVTNFFGLVNIKQEKTENKKNNKVKFFGKVLDKD